MLVKGAQVVFLQRGQDSNPCVLGTQFPVDVIPAHKPTELSENKLEIEVDDSTCDEKIHVCYGISWFLFLVRAQTIELSIAYFECRFYL